MFHASQAVLALSREENPTVFQKTLGLNDFYFGADDFEYPLGNIQMVGKSQAQMFRGEKPRRDEARARVDARADGPPRDRLLALDRGPPAAGEPRHARRRRQLTSATRRRTTRPRSGCTTKLKSMLGQARHEPGHLIHRFAYMKNEHPGRRLRAPGGHVLGSAPTRPRRRSTPNCKAHELDNLYVVDTSFFPSIGAVNPALTAMANSLRVGDHLLERLGASRRRLDGLGGEKMGAARRHDGRPRRASSSRRRRSTTSSSSR